MRLRGSVVATLFASTLGAVVTLARGAVADEPDPTYGRFAGDLAVSLGAGVVVAPRAPRGVVDLRLRYLDTVGVFGTYEDGGVFGSSSDPRRVLVVGLEARPLFLARWARGLEFGSSRLDLALDSLGFELGAIFEQPADGSFAQRPGVQAGLGLELPILTHASGPWIGLHGGLRWSADALSGETLQGPSDREAFLAITLAWHQIFGSHVVDVPTRSIE